MNIESQELDRLRIAFNSLSGGSIPSAATHPECCQASRIWQAADGALSFQETRRIIDHLAQCPQCAESWRLAREIQFETGRAGGGSRPSWMPRAAAAWATAAAMLLAAGLYLIDPFDSSLPPQMRGNEQSALQFSVSEEDPLQRDQCRLRWSLQDAGPGVRYHIQVMTLDLEPLDSARDLKDPEYTVQPDRLSHLPAGTSLVWQVSAVYEDGRRVSRQFVSRLQ